MRPICRAHDMEIVHFETLTEFLAVSNYIKDNKSLVSGEVLVDGVTTILRSTTEWFFTANGKRFPFTIPFANGEPNNYLNRNENCLALRDTGDSFLPYRFMDYPCNKIPELNDSSFLCQVSI